MFMCANAGSSQPLCVGLVGDVDSRWLLEQFTISDCPEVVTAHVRFTSWNKGSCKRSAMEGSFHIAEFLGCSKTVGAGKLTKDQQSKTSLFIAVRMEYLMCTNIVSKHMFSAESHPEGPVCPVHGPGPRPHSSFLSLVLTKATHQ